MINTQTRCLFLEEGFEVLGAATNVASVLTTDAETEGVTDTTVHVHLLHALKIFAELDINSVGGAVLGLAGLDVALTIDEPRGDLVLHGVSDDVGDLLSLSGGGDGESVAFNDGVEGDLGVGVGDGDLSDAEDVTVGDAEFDVLSGSNDGTEEFIRHDIYLNSI